MGPLDRTLRRQLEATVVEAREIAESAARTSLNQLGVGEETPYPHLSVPERDLRRKLRARARQLGDVTNGNGAKSLDRLVEEVAYEHWHRMLFARFLAENDLLMYPSSSIPVPITLEECEDLAQQEGARDGWELAARFASRMLPQIFRQDSPVFQMVFPPEYQKKLEQLVVELPVDVFEASDSLGWVYQFWQLKRKEEVNKSEVKIGARELPAVTQLFTEPYMVSFLLDNSLGAWWAARRLTKDDFASAESEEELREKASLQGVQLGYLRFVRGEDGLWAPAAGTFDEWPNDLCELKTLDPCCGSGHFLVAAFTMLVAMRMENEGLIAKDAVDAVLRENLHGLEIDQRCVELAAFALAFAAWRYPGAGGFRKLPKLNVACSGLAITAKKEEWVALAGRNQNLRYVMHQLYEQFRDAPVLGSLIDPEVELGKGTLSGITWENVEPLLESVLNGEQSDEQMELGVVAQGTIKAAQILAGKYTWVITNVPYLARSKQSEVIKKFLDLYYIDAKNDLATTFLERCIAACVKGGTISIVLPQNWLFQQTYHNLRFKLLTRETIILIAWLGAGAFETISGEVVKVVLFNLVHSLIAPNNILSQNKTKNNSHYIMGIDASSYKNIPDKRVQLIQQEIKKISQTAQINNPDSRISLEIMEAETKMSKHASSVQGLATSDDPQFIIYFWEVPLISNGWVQLRGTIKETTPFSGCERILHWEDGKGRYYQHALALKKEGRLGGWKSGTEARGKRGVIISQMSSMPVSLYCGEFYDHNTCVLLPNSQNELAAIWCYCESPEFETEVRKVDLSLKPSNNTFIKIPFNLNNWTKIAQKRYSNGLPKPYSEDPTQWFFHGHPAQSSDPLHVAIARLIGYRWPADHDMEMELSEKANKWVEKSEALLPYADVDGIMCIPSVRGESRAEAQLENLLAAAYGNEWSVVKKGELLAQADSAGRTLESWLRDKFFTQHCKLFKNRPFIWHLWDGLPDGFAVLLNYHKLDRKLLETLIYTYLGDWINRQKQEIANGVDGAEEKLAAAETLKRRLELILVGESPYDIFVRWKPIEKQPIGWDPDINDGVRINIRPFMSVPDIEKKGAGVLRDKPNIKWDKDRGKDVESAPWFNLFKGERINNHHLKLAEKNAARKGVLSFGGE